MSLVFATTNALYTSDLFPLFIGLTALSLLGLLGCTILFPMLTALFAWNLPKGQTQISTALRSPVSSLNILIPVHNDAKKLDRTLASVCAAVSSAKSSNSKISISIVVCLDHCTDNSHDVANAYGCTTILNQYSPGKWNAIKTLLRAGEPDWVALVDAGTLWDKNLILTVTSEVTENVVAIAPSYLNPSAGRLERVAWNMERWLKSLEMRGGGPIALHGATVFYRLDLLLQTLQSIPQKSWLNDDVVIPLSMRGLNKSGRVLYLPELTVSDTPEEYKTLSSDYQRRVRMMIGNVDWIKNLLPTIWRKNLSVALLSGRRVCRVFWGYWALSAALSLIVLLSGIKIELGFLGLVTTVTIFLLPSFRSVRNAWIASILAAYYLLTLCSDQTSSDPLLGSQINSGLRKEVAWR